MNRPVRPFSLLVALLAVCMFAAVGFRVGQSMHGSVAAAAGAWNGASAAAFSPAKASAYQAAWRRGYARGWRAGVAAGSSDGRRAGHTAGAAEASLGTVAARAVAAVLAATPVKLGRRVRTERCVEVADGLCEALGPRVTGKHCPSGSVADPEGGVVCVPRVLLLAARVANAPSLDVFRP